jgi:hypothetical protein
VKVGKNWRIPAAAVDVDGRVREETACGAGRGGWEEDPVLVLATEFNDAVEDAVEAERVVL